MHCDGQALTILGIFVICNVLFVSAKHDWQGMQMPAPIFDEDAPICNLQEACGFYSFTLKSRTLRWIKSWCKCGADQECVYDKTDLKMRVYRQTCAPRGESVEENEKPEEEEIQNEEILAQEHQHLLAQRSRRALAFLRNFKFQ